MGMRKNLALAAVGLFSLAASGQAFADQHAEDYSGWNGSVGGGMSFYEADQEVVAATQIYGLRAGYDFNNRWTLEGSFGYLPFMKNSNRGISEGSDEFKLNDSTWGLRFATDMLYHLDGDPTATFDPFLGTTVGLNWTDAELERGQHWDPFLGLVAGATFWVTDGLGIRSDYKLVGAGSEDPQMNHQLMVSLTYSWGRRAKAMAAAEGMNNMDNLSAGVKNPNLKNIYFPFDSSQLSSEAKATLSANADYLAKVPGSKIVLEGHCDERGTDEYNLALGERRARSAFEYLRGLGVTQDRMSTVSYGESRPAAAGHNEAAWSMNRRVECVELSN